MLKKIISITFILHTHIPKCYNGIEVYGSACNEHMNKLQVQQNRSLNVLFQKHYRTHTRDLYKDLNLLKVPAIRNVQIANILYKHKQGVLPPSFKKYFIWVMEFHDHVTRNVNKLHIRQPINANGRKWTKYQGACIWKKLPDAVKNCLIFRHLIKKKPHYLELPNC